MKGQIYLIIAIVMIITLVLIKNALNLTTILENKRYLESGLERLEFQNLRREVMKAARLSYNQTQNITNNVNDFWKFARNSFAARVVELRGLTVQSQFPTVTASTDTDLNVTVLNALQTNLQQLNLSFSYDGSSDNRTDIGDLTTVTTTFTFNTASDVNYTLTVFYKTSEENRTESITIPVEIGKSKYIGFYDIRFSSDRLDQKDRFTETFTLQ